MGCSSSKEQERPKAIVVKKTSAPSKVGLKLEDFYFKHLQEGCHIRQPGSIQGQQFIIEDCSNCDIFLLDHIAAVNIDNCTNVRIVIGACETSIFIRDCIDCVVIAATQQLRTRNCTNLGVLLCTTTGPIIESSKRVRIGCFTYDYFGFTDNLQAAGLDEWNNRWYDIYDFTPSYELNYKILPPSVNHSILLNPGYLSDMMDQGLAPVKGGMSTVISSCGPTMRGDESKAGLIVTPSYTASKKEMRAVLENWTKSRGNIIIRTATQMYSRAQLQELLGSGLARKVNEMMKIVTVPPSPVDMLQCLVVEISGEDFEKVERSFLLPGTLLFAGPKAVDKSRLLFDEWKVKI